MKTTHKIVFSNSQNMSEIPNKSVDLMVTSPPYPMIEMWDNLFSKQNSQIAEALKNNDGNQAFELMNQELDKVWNEVYRVLKNGGIACINIGDATRNINGRFQIYSNHSRILNYCLQLGFHALPQVLWIKETNKPDKFMGSGMLPVGAYVTLEHEFILILRKGDKREFKSIEEKQRRRESAFFWEERNTWFSDKWKDINGVFQKLNNKNLRERSAAFPFELAYRLINMFSLQSDLVLDPFLGTATTTLAAITSERNSIGYEIDINFKDEIISKVNDIKSFSNQYIDERLKNHMKFVKDRTESKGELKYKNKFYDFPVMARQEVGLMIDKIESIHIKENDEFDVFYSKNPQIENISDLNHKESLKKTQYKNKGQLTLHNVEQI